MKMGAKKTIRNIGRVTILIEGYVAMCVILVMTFFVFVNITMRSVFGISLNPTEEVARILMLWGGLLGVALATREKFHIGMDILPVLTQKKTFLRTTRLVSDFICLVVSSYFIYSSYKFIQNGLLLHRQTREMRIPTFWVDAAFLVSGALTAIYFLFNLIKDLKNS